MKRDKVLLFSLLIALLLAGLCSCKQEAKTPEETILEGVEQASLYAGVPGVEIPKWDKSKDGLQDLPDAVLSGSETGVTKALKAGIKNPPTLKKANNLIVMVCEGLTSDLIEKSVERYGELILESFPVKGKTNSKFSSTEGMLLVDYVRNSNCLDKTMTGLVTYGDLAANSVRRITSSSDNEAEDKTVYRAQFVLNPALKLVVGEGDYDDFVSTESSFHKNEIYKAHGKKVDSLSDAVSVYKKDDVLFTHGSDQDTGKVNKLYCIFDEDSNLPSFRQEVAFSIAWMQSIMDEDGFCLLMSYCPENAIDANGVQDFDEGVAVAVKFALENPDTAILIIGSPQDGSEGQVCFYGLGSGVSVQETAFECVSALAD